MADGAGIGEPESSEADSVSLTSTTESDGEGKEYAVDRILAEWETDGETSYLTKWDGYPEEQSTWQLRETFNPEEAGGQDVFKEWQERKMRISRGYEKPYDIDDWERRNKKLEEEVLDRRDRRRRRKAKLNHMLDALDSDPEASTDKTSSEDKSKPKARSTSQSSFEGNGTRPGNQNKFGFSLKQTPWTNAQKQVFMRGLQDANGPYWIQIFAWYGRLGTINQILRDKTLNDLQTQLQLMRQEFVDAGRDPPEYMTALKSQTEVEGAMEAKSRTRRGRKAASVGESDSSDEHTSTDSMMEEIKAKKISHSAKAMKTIELAGSRRIRKASGVADSPQILGKSARPKPIKKESSDPKSVSEIPFESTKSKPPRKESIGKAIAPPSKESNVTKHNYMSGASPLESTNRLLPRPETMKKPYAGTARTPANKSSEGVRVPNKARVGVPQSGPARFPVPSSRPRTNKAIPKAKASGIDVLANWNGEPKIRKARTLPTTNTDASANQPLRTFKTLSTRNNVQKWRRNEPAPDPSQVVFLDPRTGKAPKTLPKSSLVNAGTTSLFESPFERYQRELAAKAAEKPDLNENEETLFHNDDDRMSVDDDEPSPARRDLDTGGDLQSNSDLVRVNSEPDPPIPSYPSANTFPSMAPPTGARAPFAHFSQPHNQWPVSKSPPSSMHTWLPTESSPLSLRGYPSYYEKLELFNTLEQILVLGNIKIGPRLEDVGKMKLAGFDWDVKRLLLTIKDPIDPMRMDFEFTNICTAANYARYWHNDSTRYIGSGSVVPYSYTQEAHESLAELLASHVSAGTFFAKEFSMILWPARSSAWGFLEKGLPAVSPGAILRFAVRAPLPHLVNQIEPPITRYLRQENARKYAEIKNTIDNMPIQPEEKHITLIFREMFGIDFNRLIAPNGTQKQPPGKNFFLCFVPANCEQYEPDGAKRQALRWRTSEEHDFFVQFLRANGAETICSMQDIGSYEAVQNGSWRYFIEEVKGGAIIIHESCGRPDQLPHLARFLSAREGAMNVWMASLTPMENQSHPHLVRYLPHGGVILLTVSLIIYCPYEALRILRWFRLDYLPGKHSGTWKVAVRPRIREWLMDIHDLCHEESWQSPFGDFNLQVYADIRTEIYFLLERDVEPWGYMVETWDAEVPLPEAPVVAEVELPRGRKEWTGDSFNTAKIDHDAVRWNDEELIQWFCEWAGANLQEHRKFHVVLGYPKGDKEGDHLRKCYEKGYGFLDDGPNKPGRQERGLFKRPDGSKIRSAWERNFLEIMPYDQFCIRHNVPDHATLNKKEADRGQQDSDALARLREETEAERKEEREVARHALATIKQICRDQGGTEEQARAFGRRHLLWRRDEQGTASDKEVEDCEIDMDWRQPNPYMAGTEEEREAVLREQRREKKRLADKEIFSGTKERERMWGREIEMWAVRDGEKEAARDAVAGEVGRGNAAFSSGRMRMRDEERKRKKARLEGVGAERRAGLDGAVDEEERGGIHNEGIAGA